MESADLVQSFKIPRSSRMARQTRSGANCSSDAVSSISDAGAARFFSIWAVRIRFPPATSHVRTASTSRTRAKLAAFGQRRWMDLGAVVRPPSTTRNLFGTGPPPDPSINVPFLISSRVALAMTTASLKDGKS